MIPSGENSPPLKRGGSIILFLILVLAGLAGNYYSFELFFNIQFTFGSIFALLALQFFGLRPGVLAGAIISSITVVLWNHPYAIVIMTAEVLVVGALTGWRKVDLVLADMLYWLVLGIPLVLLFYYGIMDTALYNTYAIMMKQAVNGIANAVAARLAYMGVIQRSRVVRFPLQEVFFDLLAAAVLVLSLFIVFREGRGDLRDADRSIRGSLVQARARMTETLEQTVRSRLSTIVYLAGVAEHRPPASLQESLEQAHAMHSDFLRIGLQDREGIVVAFSPRRDEYGRPHIGKSYADRPFIPNLMRDRKPMLSDVEISRFGEPRPRVGVIAPVIAKGRYEGFVFGALDLARLQAPLELAARGELVQGLRFTLVDEHERVIVTSRDDLKVMDPFSRPAGELRRQDDGISQWLPVGRKNAPPSDRWRDSLYITESAIGEGAQWRLILELPIAPVQRMLAGKYTAYLTDIFGLLLAMLLAGRFLSRGAVNSLERLADLSSRIPSAVASGERIDWPSSSIAETDRLIANLRDMSQVIAIQFYKIRKMNEDLERAVSDRTVELRESRERFRALIESASDWVWEVDEDGRYTYASPRVRHLLGYEPQEVIGKTPFDLMSPGEARRVSAEFAARVRARQPIVGLENVNLHKDGHVVILETSGVPIADADGRFKGYRGIDRDVTARREAEEKFRQLAKEQQTILNTIPVGISYSKDRKLMWTNPAFERMFGYGPDEARGLEARVLYAHAEDYDRVGSEGYPLIMEGAVYSTEVLALRKDGGSFWMSLTGVAMSPDDIGQGTIWMMQDIAERKRAEQLLRESEGRLARAQHVAKVGNWEWNVQTNEIAWSDEVYRFYGIDPGRDKPSFETVVGALAPECRDRFMKAIDEALRGSMRFEGRYRVILADGQERYMYTVGDVARDDAGRPNSMFGVAQDITELVATENALRKNRQRLADIIDGTNVGTWEWNVQTGETVFNERWAEILGYTLADLEPVSIRTWMDLAHPDDLKVSEDRLQRHFAGELAYYEYECRMKHRDGHWVWVLDRGKVTSWTADGKPLMMSGTHTDISERKRAEQELHEKTQQLEDLTRSLEKRVQEETESRIRGEQLLFQQSKMAAMGEMLGAIAHQWRQPLTGLGLIIQNLRDAHAYGELDGAYLQEAVEKSMAQIRRMSKTIDDFRTFFRPDKERTRFDAMQAVGDVLSLLAAQLTASNLDVRVTCRTHSRTFTRIEDIVPCSEKTISGYRNEFEHVVMNLISNARDAVQDRMESGRMGKDERGFIAIDFLQADGTVRIEVADNGGGVREDIIDRIFEPYFTTKDQARGTGLGLYMSKVIIEDHMQGKLSARNSGDGAVISIDLPVV